MTPLRIIFAGSGEFGLPTLGALHEAGHHLVQVISQPDRPAGRGRRLHPTPITRFALDADLPLLRTDNINCEPLPPAEVMVVIAFGQKIAESAVHHPRLGSINLHASILPRHRGASPINHAILSGDTVTGNSIIRLAPRMDAGNVLAQSSLPIGSTETAGELHDRLALDGRALVLRVLDELAAGVVIEVPQDEAQATLAPRLSRRDARLDFTQEADTIARTIRGLSPWPGCRVQLVDATGEAQSRVTLLSARPVTDQATRRSAGEILPDGSIAAADTSVEILRLQPEGGRPMSLDDYRNGHPWRAGLRVEPI